MGRCLTLKRAAASRESFNSNSCEKLLTYMLLTLVSSNPMPAAIQCA